MTDAQWGALTPKEVSDWMSFERDNAEWLYDPDNNQSMAAKQAEGTAYLWNTLGLHNVAILADEVGMGKTFQAIAVACLLWKMKPDAKVLVMAPNRDICAHWKGEYHTFVDAHYKKTDHLVRNAADGGPVNESRLCNRLPELVEDLKRGGCSFYFTTIYALSGLLPIDQKSGDKAQRAKVAAANLHKEIKQVLGDNGFDLLIIDEAHYFRNVKGGSQRASAAQAFFGEVDKLAQKTLLMTATPSHSGMQDVASILSYFVDDIEKSADTKVLLDKYALRRLRRMKGKGQDRFHTKHDYRNEIAARADFENNPGAELFFALYQKKLVTEVQQATNGKRFLYGFLEGFESVGADQLTRQDQTEYGDEAADTDNVKTAFRSAPDTEILKQLTGQYYQHFSTFPEHPKYSTLVEELLPEGLFRGKRDLHEDKHLIFVRRIPSVRELTQRVNRAYDDLFIERMLKAWGLAVNSTEAKRWEKKKWSREGFNQLVDSLSGDTGVGDIDEWSDDTDAEGEEANIGSLVSNLFVVKKGKGGTTDCSNLRLRFSKPESLFALFLEPASDYKTGGYTYYYPVDTRNIRDNYLDAAKDQRLLAFDQLTRRIEHSEYDNRSKRIFDDELPTAWSLIFDLLDDDQQTKISKWSQTPAVLENFATYIRAGFVYASPVMVELYCWFTEVNLKHNLSRMKSVQKRYLAFIRYVKPRLRESLLFSYFVNALDSFEALCTKIKRQELHDWQSDWRQLVNLQHPALYASGEVSNRQRLILGFNSPFYPNVLTATSVFQEGVNLHLQCRKVHHYGLAGSPGDNEQRIGRIDRLFGKVNDDLARNGTGQLSISYPYLANSFDEDQLASFVMRKHDVEQKMDHCQPIDSDSSIDFHSSTLDWLQFLRKPEPAMRGEHRDPYPARFNAARKPEINYQERAVHDTDTLKEHIYSLCCNAVEATNGTVLTAENRLNKHVLYLLDNSVIPVSGIPQHPVQVEKHFSSEFSGLVSGTVYYLTLKSPLVSQDYIKRRDTQLADKAFYFSGQHHNQYPLVQLALDEQASKSHFYLHMKVDLPLFVISDKYSMLSSQEFSHAYEQLRHFTDLLKGNLFSESQGDIKKAVLAFPLSSESKQHAAGNDTAHNCFDVADLSSDWSVSESLGGQIVTRCCDIPKDEFADRHKLGSGGVNPTKLMMLNHHYPFLNFHLHAEYCRVSLNYPAADFQRDEQSLLDRWFEYCK